MKNSRKILSFALPALLMSLVLRPLLLPSQAQRATMLCSLAVVEAVGEVTGLLARLKWPNDILLNSKKLGGILTELGATKKRLDYVIVGIGLNVNVSVDSLPELMAPATSLLDELGTPASRLDLLVAILEAIDEEYTRLREGWSPHTDWKEHLVTLGERVRVTTSDGVVEGVAEDVDRDGALLVRAATGELVSFLAGDVTLSETALGADDKHTA